MATRASTDSSRTEAVATSYFTALTDRDLDTAVACWKPGSDDHLGPVGLLHGRQLGLLPGRGSAQERAMKTAFNARTRVAARLRRRKSG